MVSLMEQEWVRDDNGNAASISYFGSVEVAKAALASLSNCTNTTNCFRCDGCKNCTECWYCEMCSDSVMCLCSVALEDCARCIWTLRAVHSSYLAGCHYCEQCHDCVDCTDCIRCARCADCYDCKECHNLTTKKQIGDEIGPMTEIPSVSNEAVASLLSTIPGMLAWSPQEEFDAPSPAAIIALAGRAGTALESVFGTDLAAIMIARQSGCELNPIQMYGCPTTN